MVGLIFAGVIYLGCAALFFGIGISQIRSKKPVAFYAGEKPFEAEALSDVHAWNKKHGIMWIVYSCIIILSWLCGFLCGDSPWILIPFIGGLLIPLIFMIRYHHKLIEKYVIR